MINSFNKGINCQNSNLVLTQFKWLIYYIQKTYKIFGVSLINFLKCDHSEIQFKLYTCILTQSDVTFITGLHQTQKHEII